MVIIRKSELKRRIIMAMNWLSDIAIKKDEYITNEFNVLKAMHNYWKGAIKNEYIVSSRKWQFYAPIWHSGQAIKSLVLGVQQDFVENKKKYINSAKKIANFILKNQIWDKDDPDHGLILAYEDVPGYITTSGILEASHGLLLLSKITGENIYKERVIAALNYCADKLYINGKGLFHDCYDYKNRKIKNPYQSHNSEVGRPLNDDSIFLKAYKLTKKKIFKNIFWEIIDKLIEKEGPPGNWIEYWPCSRIKGFIHPRHAYWWGCPFLKAYSETKKKKYLDVAKRACDWYKKAIRKDGGLFRNTYRDFNTDSFRHATSGAACATILWILYRKTTGTKVYDSLIRTCLNYCMKMQFTNPQDKNLLGCILEKVLPPDGTDKSPYFIRDLGTIFFIQAAVNYLKSF
ncbi:MAG: hypothetical protein ACTSQJ_05005 [Promethearchaeota archaeon]